MRITLSITLSPSTLGRDNDNLPFSLRVRHFEEFVIAQVSLSQLRAFLQSCSNATNYDDDE